jgi:hypothetical protein
MVVAPERRVTPQQGVQSSSPTYIMVMVEWTKNVNAQLLVIPSKHRKTISNHTSHNHRRIS